MDRSQAAALEFDKVIDLVSAHARTGVGRSFLEELPPAFATDEDPAGPALLTLALHDLIEEGDTISFAGLDEAVPWLEIDAPPPSEPRDLLSLLNLARRVAATRRRLDNSDSELLTEIVDRLPDTSPLVDQVAPLLKRDGTISDTASPELTRLRREIGRARTDALAELEAVRRSHRDAVTDAPPTLRRDRYCLPVRSSARSQMSGLLLDVSGSGATAFIEPFSMVEFNNRLAAAIVGEAQEIQRILHEISRLFAEAREDLADAVGVLGGLDALQAKVLFGRACEGRVVIPGDGRDLLLLGARHPLLDERLHGLRAAVFGGNERRDPGHQVVPLNFKMPDGVNTLVISGPNAGGKTVVIKTVGLMVLMCRHGIPLPVAEGTCVPQFSQLWCRIGDEQDVAADLSTFSGAMAATAQMLADADGRTLVLFDELGAGTDPLEGAALGCALLEELTERGGLSVVTTHLAGIAMTASSTEAMDNAAMEYDEGSERPTYVLSLGRPGRSRALEIATRMGLPSKVLDRARELLGGEHLELDRWLRRLEALEGQLEAERLELKQKRFEADLDRIDAQRALEKLEGERREIPAQLAAERDDLRRRAKVKLDKAVNRLRQAIEERESLGRRRLEKLREEALRLELPKDDTTAGPVDGLVEGARVRTALGGTGVLGDIRGTQARVDVSGKKLWVPLAELVLVKGPAPKPKASIGVDTAGGAARELKLIGLDSERAREDLERFLDQAYSAGLSSIRVVHGHGAGILRKMVTEACRSHPAVRSFRHPPQHLGGNGATEIDLDQGS